MRMPEPTGQILIDGQNIQQLSLPSYRSKISVIPQDPVLFSGPLRFNLDPGSEFQDAQIWDALEAVRLKPLIQKQDKKLHCDISEGGSNFSVGEKQFLSSQKYYNRKSSFFACFLKGNLTTNIFLVGYQ